MSSSFRVFGKGLKAQNLGEGVSAPDSGNCGICGEWESELKNGLCPDCRNPDNVVKRIKREIRQGKAQGLVYYEDMGKPGIQIKRK